MDIKTARTRSVLEDNLWKLMIRLSLPGIVGMGIISLGSLIDAVFVGQHLGSEAIAGISLVFPLTIVNNAVVSLIAAGAASVFSRALGGNNSLAIERVFGNVLFLSLILSATLTGLGFTFSEELVTLMGGSGAAFTYANEYYQVLISGAFFGIFGLSSNALIRAEGSIKTAMTFAGIAVGVNLLLTLLFVNVLKWGIQGAAWGTVLSMVVYLILNIIYFLSGKSNIPRKSIIICFDQVYLREILSIGLSAFLMQGVNFIRQTFIFRSMAYYGSSSDLAFLGATLRIFMFAIIPVFGVLQAMQPVIGINFGAKKPERSIKAVKIFRTGAILLLLLLLLPCLLYPKFILSFILPDYPYSAAELFNFRLVMLVLPFLPFASTGIVFFQATGKGKIASRLSLGRELIFVPAIIVFPLWLGIEGIYIGVVFENLIYTLIVFLITRDAFKKSNKAGGRLCYKSLH